MGPRQSKPPKGSPAAPSVVFAETALQRLGTPGVSAAPLTLLVAPHGYGKTALLDHWRQTLPPEVTVLRLNAKGTKRAEDLWDGIARGLASVAPAAVSMQGATRYAAALFLAGTLKSPTVLLVDDYAELTAPEQDLSLVRLLEASDHLYLCLASTRTAALDTALTFSRVDTNLLTKEELRLDPSRVTALQAARGIPQLSEAGAALDAAGGWPALTELILGAADPSGALDRDRVAAAAEAAASRAGVKAVRIMALLGLLGEASGEVLRVEAQDPADLTATLLALQREGLVERHWKHHREVYRARPGLRETGFWGASWEVPTSEIPQLLESHTKDLSERDPGTALAILLKNSLWEQADRLAGAHFGQLLSQLDSTPKELLDAAEDPLVQLPSLAGLRLFLLLAEGAAAAQITLQSAQIARTGAERALKDRRAKNEHSTCHGSLLSAIQLTAERTLGEWASAATHASQLELQIAGAHDQESAQAQTNLAHIYLAVARTALGAGAFDLAERTAKHALSLASAVADPFAIASSLGQLALLEVRRAHGPAAEEYLSRLDKIESEAGPAKLPTTGEAAVARAAMHVLQGSPALGLAALQAPGFIPGTIEVWSHSVYTEAWALRFTEGPRAGLARLRSRLEDREPVPLSESMTAHVAAAGANLAMDAGELVAAGEMLDRAPRTQPEVILARVRLSLLDGDPRQAAALAPTVADVSEPGVQTDRAILLGAIALHAAQDSAGALATLEMIPPERIDRQALVLSALPYEPLRDLAVTASAAGNPRLLEMVNQIPDHYKAVNTEPLSAAELRVLNVFDEQTSVAAAAETLGLSANTVKSHLKRIYLKLRVRNRVQMVKAARRAGLLESAAESAVSRARTAAGRGGA